MISLWWDIAVLPLQQKRLAAPIFSPGTTLGSWSSFWELSLGQNAVCTWILSSCYTQSVQSAPKTPHSCLLLNRKLIDRNPTPYRQPPQILQLSSLFRELSTSAPTPPCFKTQCVGKPNRSTVADQNAIGELVNASIITVKVHPRVTEPRGKTID